MTKERYLELLENDELFNYINNLKQQHQYYKKDIKNIISILEKNCFEDLEATEEEFKSLERWSDENNV